MTSNWQVKTLDELCEVVRGGSPRPIQDFLTSGPDGVNWIKISDATASGKYIYETKEKIRPEGVSRSRLVKPGDFLLSNSMSFGRPYIMRTSGCVHDGWLVLSDKSGLFDQDYLYHFLSSRNAYNQFDQLAAGSTVRNLNIESAKKVKVLLPLIAEQKRIVAILDEAFEAIGAAIANAEKNLANARELLENYLDSIFARGGKGWVEKRLGEIAAFKNGLNFTKGSKGEIIKIVGVKDFQANFYVPTGHLETAQIDGSLSTDYELRAGDILTVRSNGNKQLIGRCILASDVSEKTSHSGFTIRIRVAPAKVFPTYLAHFLKSKASREALIESGDGANISSLNQQALSSLPISLPPFHEQLAIAERIQAIEAKTKKLEIIYRHKLNNLAELKQAILKKAFAGELTARSATARSATALQQAAE